MKRYAIWLDLSYLSMCQMSLFRYIHTLTLLDFQILVPSESKTDKTIITQSQIIMKNLLSHSTITNLEIDELYYRFILCHKILYSSKLSGQFNIYLFIYIHTAKRNWKLRLT